MEISNLNSGNRELIKEQQDKICSKYEFRTLVIASLASTCLTTYIVSSTISALSGAVFIPLLVTFPIAALVCTVAVKYFESKTHFWGEQISKIALLEDQFNRNKEKIDEYHLLLEKDPTNRIAQFQLESAKIIRAAIYCQMAVNGQTQKLQEVNKELTEIIKKEVHDPRGDLIYGEYLRLTSNYPKALDIFKKVINTSKSPLDRKYALTSLAELYRQTGEKEKFAEVYREIADIDPDNEYFTTCLHDLDNDSRMASCQDWLERSFCRKMIPNRIEEFLT